MGAQQTRRKELQAVVALATPAELQGDLLPQQRHHTAGHRRRATLLRATIDTGTPDGVEDGKAEGMPGQQAGASGCRWPGLGFSGDDDGGIHRRPDTGEGLPEGAQPHGDRPVRGAQHEQMRVGLWRHRGRARH